MTAGSSQRSRWWRRRFSGQTWSGRDGRAPCRGFTYVGLLVFVAILGIASAATLQMGSVVQRRAAEDELLLVGMEYRRALISYAQRTPAGQLRQPKSLADLLKDPRYPNTVRHLRKLYPDPITGKAEWGLIQGVEGGGISGVYSLSEAMPIKIDNFDPELAHFKGKTSYREWQFSVLPTTPARPSRPTANPRSNQTRQDGYVTPDVSNRL